MYIALTLMFLARELPTHVTSATEEQGNLTLLLADRISGHWHLLGLARWGPATILLLVDGQPVWFPFVPLNRAPGDGR